MDAFATSISNRGQESDKLLTKYKEVKSLREILKDGHFIRIIEEWMLLYQLLTIYIKNCYNMDGFEKLDVWKRLSERVSYAYEVARWVLVLNDIANPAPPRFTPPKQPSTQAGNDNFNPGDAIIGLGIFGFSAYAAYALLSPEPVTKLAAGCVVLGALGFSEP